MAGIVIRKFRTRTLSPQRGQAGNERDVESTASLVEELTPKRGSQKHL
jgi:hypothetical protein